MKGWVGLLTLDCKLYLYQIFYKHNIQLVGIEASSTFKES